MDEIATFGVDRPRRRRGLLAGALRPPADRAVRDSQRGALPGRGGGRLRPRARLPGRDLVRDGRAGRASSRSIVILFDGGMEIGWRRLRQSIVPVVSLGLLGTFVIGRPDRGGRALAARPLVDHGRPPRGGARADRPGRHVLRARRPRGARPDGDDPERRVGRERPGRDRADDRDDRVRDERRRLVLDGRRASSRSRWWAARSSASPAPRCSSG